MRKILLVILLSFVFIGFQYVQAGSMGNSQYILNIDQTLFSGNTSNSNYRISGVSGVLYNLNSLINSSGNGGSSLQYRYRIPENKPINNEGRSSLGLENLSTDKSRKDLENVSKNDDVLTSETSNLLEAGIWAWLVLKQSYKYGLIQTVDGFVPNHFYTKEEFLQMIYKSFIEDEIQSKTIKQIFKNINEEDSYFNSLGYAYKKGYISGEVISGERFFNKGQVFTKKETMQILIIESGLLENSADFNELKNIKSPLWDNFIQNNDKRLFDENKFFTKIELLEIINSFISISED